LLDAPDYTYGNQFYVLGGLEANPEDKTVSAGKVVKYVGMKPE
jgi:hypothetical protein